MKGQYPCLCVCCTHVSQSAYIPFFKMKKLDKKMTGEKCLPDEAETHFERIIVFSLAQIPLS